VLAGEDKKTEADYLRTKDQGVPMNKLRYVKPEIVKPSKPKFMLSGKSGVGKSEFALNFPKPFYMDTEGGATREQYMAKLIESQGVYVGKDLGTQDFNSVIEQIKTLASTKHEFKTLIIDSFSKLYNIAAAEAEERIGNDYGRDRKEANKPTRQLLRWIDKLDMTTILICHQKDKVGTKREGHPLHRHDL
jgi:hypothetical protein